MASQTDDGVVASGSVTNLKKNTNADLCGNVLTNIIVVVEKIFKCLNARHLNTCARVCKVWNYQAKREKESRYWMRWDYFTADHQEAGDFNAHEWWKCVKTFIMDSLIEPGFVLMFCSEALCCHLTEVKHKKRKQTKPDPDLLWLLEPILPKDCGFQAIISDGIVGTDNKMKIEELEEYELAFSLIMFGKDSLKQPGFDLEFIPFTLSSDECKHLNKFWSEGSNVPPSFMQKMLLKEVKMVNIYASINGMDQEVGYSFFRMLRCPLVAGGSVNSTVLRDGNGKVSGTDGVPNAKLAGFALCGKNVQVASVLIKSGVDTEEEVDDVIKTLKDHNLPLDHCFGLMYACVGRGANLYESPNVESSVFRRHFPNTPLLGFFGNGEIGCSYPTPALPVPKNGDKLEEDGSEEKSSDSQGKSRNLRRTLRSSAYRVVEADDLKHPPKLLHAYTTVMCLVSISSL